MRIKPYLQYCSLLITVFTFSINSTYATVLNSPHLKRQRVAVIGGGGAGITVSWLLDEQYDVTLFEKSDRLGGHANTLPVRFGDKIYPIDAGFEFINASEFPNFVRLLRSLNLELKPFQLTTSFYSTNGKRSFVLTPVRNEGLAWGSLLQPKNLLDLLRLKSFFDKGRKFVWDQQENRSEVETVLMEAYLTQQNLNVDFRDLFLLPLLASGWGVPIKEIKNWSTENVLRTIISKTEGVSAPEWLEIVGGTSHYIDVVRDQLTHAEVKLSSKITNVTYNESDERYTITTSEGESHFEHLIIGTAADQVATLLKDIDLPEIIKIKSVLSQVEHFQSTLALHGDERFMPVNKKHWSVVNVRTYPNGTQSAMTLYKKWHSPEGKPVFKSWILQGDPLPQPLYAEAHYQHPKLTLPYVFSQRAVATFQGKHHLWFVGAHTLGDRHESAILSALHVARKLSPESQRLKLLEAQEVNHYQP